MFHLPSFALKMELAAKNGRTTSTAAPAGLHQRQVLLPPGFRRMGCLANQTLRSVCRGAWEFFQKAIAGQKPARLAKAKAPERLPKRTKTHFSSLSQSSTGISWILDASARFLLGDTAKHGGLINRRRSRGGSKKMKGPGRGRSRGAGPSVLTRKRRWGGLDKRINVLQARKTPGRTAEIFHLAQAQ